MPSAMVYMASSNKWNIGKWQNTPNLVTSEKNAVNMGFSALVT